MQGKNLDGPGVIFREAARHKWASHEPRNSTNEVACASDAAAVKSSQSRFGSRKAEWTEWREATRGVIGADGTTDSSADDHGATAADAGLHDMTRWRLIERWWRTHSCGLARFPA